ncbi:MAG: ATP-grasp domain-containing protein [Rhodospirillales bacterium]
MKASDIHVAVSGFAGLNNPHPGIPAARALRAGWRGRLEIHALGYDVFMTGAWMPGIADRLHLLPSLDEGDEAVLERIMEIHANVRLDAIIPCLDLEMPIFSRLAQRLSHEGIMTLLPPPESIYATSKLRLPMFSHDNDIRAPKTIHVLNMDDVTLHAEQFGFPLMVKGTVTGAKRVGNADQARKEAEILNDKWGAGVLLQEPIAGEEFVVGAVQSGSGSCLGLVAMRKLGVNPDGKAVFGSVIDDPKIEREAKRILEKLNWAGPLELEFIRPHGSDQFYLLEINCRFASWILLSAFAGCNLPVLLLREILKPGRRRIARPHPGTMFVRNVEETTVSLAQVSRLQRHRTEPGPAPFRRRPKSTAKGDIRVAVTGLGTNDVINPGLGVVTALDGVPDIASIYGLGYGVFDSGLYRSDLLDAAFRLPQEDDAQVLLDRLTDIHREAPFDVIIPCLDGEIPRVIEIEPQLNGLGIRTLLPSRDALDRCGKLNLFTGRGRRDWGGFEIPKTYRARSERDIVTATRRLGYPVVIKGPVSESIPAANAWEAQTAWYKLREKGIEEALVQPQIIGDHLAVAAVCDRDHEARTLLTVKKLSRCDRGSTWGAINTRQPELESAFAGFLKHLGWCGPTEGEFIRDERSDRFFLIEVNPRFTAWISFSAALGLNHPLQAVFLALGRDYDPKPISSELVFMRSCREFPVDTRDFAAISTKGRLQNG